MRLGILLIFAALCSPLRSQEYDTKLVELIDVNKLAKAEKRLSKLYKSESDSLDFYYLQGKIQRKQGDYLTALTSFFRVLIADSTYAYAYDEIGVIFSIHEKYDEALEQYATGLVYRPNDPLILGHIGATYYQMKDFEGAIDYLQQVLVLEPLNDYAMYNLGLCYLSLEDYSKAIDYFNQTLSLSNDDFKTYFDRGKAYYFSGNYELALADFKKSQKLVNHENAYEFIPKEDYTFFISRCQQKINTAKEN